MPLALSGTPAAATPAAPAAVRAADPPPVPGQQPGDLIRDGESSGTMPGFSYNNRASGLPPQCGSNGQPPAGSALPYCQELDHTTVFDINSLTRTPGYWKMIVTANNPAYASIRFYVPYYGNNYGEHTSYFTSASHGWLFGTELYNDVSSGDNVGGGRVVKCDYHVACEVDMQTYDQYGGYVGDAFADLHVQTRTSTGQAGVEGHTFIPLGLTRQVTGYVRNTDGSGLPGATVTATGPGGQTVTATSRPPSNATGLYAMNLPAQSGWTLAATDAANDIFDPARATPDLVNTIPTQDFVVRPGLSSAIAVLTPDGGAYKQGSALPGDRLVARVTLSNAANAPALSGLTRDDALSSTSAPVSLGTPGPLETTTLAPGASTTYDVPMTVTGTGRTTLQVAAHGTGTAREDTSTEQLLVLGSPLLITYRFSRGGVDLTAADPTNTFTLPDSDDGEAPTDVTVSEKILNRSGATVDTLTAQALDLLTVDPKAAHLPFPVTVTSGPTYAPGFTGTLADGASTTVTWTLHVVKNIDLRVRDLVLSHSADGGPNDVSLGEDVLDVRPAHELLLKVTNDGGTGPVKTGHPFTLTGTVTNLDQSRPLDLDPLIPDFAGNAGGQAARTHGSPTVDGFVPPVAGRLDAGEQKTFTVTVQTIKEAGTRGTVTWAPAGKVVNTDGTLSALAGKDIRVADGTTPMTLHLDDKDPAPIATTATERAWVFSAEALAAMRDWCANGLHAITDWRGGLSSIGSGLVAAGGIAVKNVQAYAVGVTFVRSVTGVAFFWAFLSDAQRRQFVDEIVLDVGATNAAWKEFTGGINSAVYSYLLTYVTAVAQGDLLRVAQLRGQAVGTGLPEGLSLFLPDLILNKVARGLSWGTRVAGGVKDSTVARAISLGEKVKESNLILKAAKAVQGARVGTDLLADGAKILRTQYGMAARDIGALRYWAQKNNLLIAVRQRSELTLKWLKEKAVLKPELIKIKNVDEIDTHYLGYLAHDEGSVVFREPLDKKLVQAKIRSAPLEVREAIAKRYGQRVKEWKKYEKQYKSWSGTVQDLGFDKAAQGVAEKTKSKLRHFNLGEPVKVHGGGEYYRVMIGDAHGTLRRVTGDIDVVAITLADGRVPSAAVRARLYEDLQEAIGMQHGETLSWILNGELLSKVKAGLLADHLPGRELLAVFGPDGGCRAAYFDPKLTIFNSQTGEAAATFIGAYSTPLQRAARYAGVSLARFY